MNLIGRIIDFTPIDIIQNLRSLQISLTSWGHKMKKLKETNKRIDMEKMSCIVNFGLK